MPASLLSLLAALACPAAHASTFLPTAQGWVVERWTTQDGLPSDSAYSLSTDQRRRLVLGTSDGLVFYDGIRFETLRKGAPAGPPDDRALWVGQDTQGALWVVTEIGRVQRREGLKVTDYGTLGSTPPYVISWPRPMLVTTSSGVWELDGTPTLREELPPDTRAAIEWDSELWALSQDTLYHRAGPNAELSQRPATAQAEQEFEDFSQRVSAQRAPRFESTPNSVSYQGQLLLETSERITDLLEYQGTLWVSTVGQGLYQLRETPLHVHQNQGGDSKRSWTAQVFWDTPSQSIWAPYPDGSGWWSPTDGSWSHPAMDSGQPLDAPADVWPVPLSPDGEQRWWAFGTELLSQTVSEPHSEGIKQSMHPAQRPIGAQRFATGCSQYMRADTPGPDGTHYTAWGTVWTGEAWDLLPEAARCLPELRAMVYIPRIGLLMGGHGLSLLTPQGELLQVKTPAAIRPRHLRIDQELVWMSTEAYGLCVAQTARLPAPTWRCLNPESGFPESQLHASVQDDKGRVWLSSNRGLYMALQSELLAYAHGEIEEVGALLVSQRWGLENPELNGFAGYSVAQGQGSYWFPGQSGLLELDPPGPPWSCTPSPPARVRSRFKPSSWAPGDRPRPCAITAHPPSPRASGSPCSSWESA